MKKLNYFILICLINSNLLSQSVILSEEAINKKIIVIKKTIARHNYMVSGLTVLGYMHQLSLLLTGLEYFFPESYNKNNIPVSTQSSQPAHNNDQNKAEARGFFAGIAHDTKELFCTEKGWKTIGMTTFSLAGQIGAFCLFQKIADTIYHPDTLRWYIRTNVAYDKTIAVIESVTKKLTFIDHMNSAQRVYYETILKKSCVQLAGYAEDICAYMIYKAEKLSRNQKMLAETTARYLLNYQKDVFNHIFVLLAQKDLHSAELIKIIQAYHQELHYQCHIFASIEGETMEDLRETYD